MSDPLRFKFVVAFGGSQPRLFLGSQSTEEGETVKDGLIAVGHTDIQSFLAEIRGYGQ